MRSSSRSRRCSDRPSTNRKVVGQGVLRGYRAARRKYANEAVARPARVQDLWLTPSDAAARLKVSRATIYKLLKNRELPHHRVGLSIRIASADLEAFLE